MKQTLASLTAALYLSMFGCGEKEPECTKFENIAEVVYSQDNKDKSWSWNSDNGNTYMCYSSNPPCPDDSGSYVILGYGISLVQSSISVDPSTRTQRIIIVGNVYGSGTDIGLTVDDYDDSSEYDLKEDQYLSREELSEREDCSLNSIIFDLYKRPDYHNINTDGNVDVSINSQDCGGGQQQPECPGNDNYGCIGLSKIILQQCVEYQQ